MPEIQEVRGVNAVSVLKTLLDKKLITTSGRKNVVGRPILYRTTKEFLVHFGLKNLDELPSLEEFEELARSASDSVAETIAEGDTTEATLKEAVALGGSPASLSPDVKTAEIDPVDAAEPTIESGDDLTTVELFADLEGQTEESS